MPSLRCLAPLALVACLASSSAIGCGGDRAAGDPVLTIYVSAPAEGPGTRAGREVLEGARLALAEAGEEANGVEVRVEPADAEGEEDYEQAAVAARARAATRDSTAIAYVGEPDAATTAVSAPILNEAGMLQLSPAPLPESLLRAEPGGTGVRRDLQPTGERTLGALALAGGPAPPGATLPGSREGGGESPPAAVAGYEAVAVILDSIERAGDPLDRAAVLDAYMGTADRESVLGRYSVDPIGVARFERPVS